jgi:hypothetical protein
MMDGLVVIAGIYLRSRGYDSEKEMDEGQKCQTLC